MRQIDSPAKFSIAFASGAGAPYIRQIPLASQITIQTGAASLTDGFPPATFLPKTGGGAPPFGSDHNGILNQITAWVRAMTAGIPIMYDAAFQTAIGGYPANAWIRSAGNPALIYQCLADNNMTNPDAGGANWSAPTFVQFGTEGLIIDGHLSSSFGAGLRLYGTGGTPNKWLRAINGYFSIVNNAYSAEILTLLDGGQLSTGSSITANTGDITAANGNLAAGVDLTVGRNAYVAGQISSGGNIVAGARLRAVLGAYGSGDGNAASLLADFGWSASVPGYQRLPNGFVIQWGRFVSVTGNGDVFNWPTAFPNSGLQVIGCDDGSQMAACGFSFVGTGQTQVRMWSGFANNGVPTYTTGTGILFIALGF